MIGQLTVNISAKDPTRKCETFRAFVGSPSFVRIVGVPSSLGNWRIQTVYFTVNYPDNRSVGRTCKAGVGVYVATVDGSTLPGKSLLGYTVKADGVDENGEPVIGYVLGKGDVEIVDADATLTPGETIYYIHVLDSRPESPRKGDAYVDGGVWWFYNGEAWVTLGGTFAGNGWAQYPQSQGGDGKWHRVIISNGALAYDEQGFDEPPDAEPFALKSELTAEVERATSAERENAAAIEAEHARASGAESALRTALTNEIARAGAAEESAVHNVGDETVNGVKTFSASPLVPTVDSADDDSMKSASTGWVVKKLAAWWATVKSTLTKSDVGLGNVDNTSDTDKPVSTETQAALDEKANDNAVVKLTGNQVISGIKSFGSAIVVASSALKRTAANSYAYFHGGTSARDGATITLAGSLYEGTALPAGGFMLAATDGKSETGEGEFSTTSNLSLSPNGHLKLIGYGPDMDPQVFGPQFAMAGMPSNTVVNLTLPGSGGFVQFSSGVYTAQYSGWITIDMQAGSAGQYLIISTHRINDASTLISLYADSSIAGRHVRVLAPILRGQRCRVEYSLSGDVGFCRFIMAEAEVNK